MGWLGLDDTDSLSGGCTTAAFHALLNGLPDGITHGMPRLVRLWPFAQRRTRGNAALAVELNTVDESILFDHLDAWWKEHLEPLDGLVEESTLSDRKQTPASPGMVFYHSSPPPEFYWDAVRREVRLDEVPPPDRAWGGCGRIGAAAAAAWPAHQPTWEAIAWRAGLNTDAARSVDHDAVVEVDGWDEVVFSRDPRRGTNLIAPRGPSPVLFGVRATSASAAEQACIRVAQAPGTEEVADWRVFVTNQASGDHLPPSSMHEVVNIETHPVRKHARIHTEDHIINVYAEGGPVNALARWLVPGDVISVTGLLHPDGSLHAERMKVESWVARGRMRPLCAACNVRLKSMGSGQGLRCPTCKERSEDAWMDVSTKPPHMGWVEPPVDARRHLARPLSWEELADDR